MQKKIQYHIKKNQCHNFWLTFRPILAKIGPKNVISLYYLDFDHNQQKKNFVWSLSLEILQKKQSLCKIGEILVLKVGRLWHNTCKSSYFCHFYYLHQHNNVILTQNFQHVKKFDKFRQHWFTILDLVF